MRPFFLAALVALPHAALADAHSQTPAEAVAVVEDRDGNAIGNVRIVATPSGIMHVVVQLEGLDAGVNGAHLHEVGDCSASDFTSAGDHISGDAEHGPMAEGGPHPGDLPNLHIQSDGVAAAEFFNDRIDMATLLDEDGSAFILHAQSDDYVSQPGGNAGDRIACGVIQAALDQ